MPRRFARGFRRGTRTVNGVKRKHIWAKDGALIPVADGAVSHRNALAVFETALGSELLGATVQLSHLDIRTQTTSAIPDVLGTVTFGARIFTEATLAALTVAQGPISDPFADWMTYFPMIVAATTQDVGIAQWKEQFKSMRTMDELGEGLLVSVENQSSAAVTVAYSISVGVLLA